MRQLAYHPNPIEQSYNGGDSLNVRQVQSFCNSVNVNFNTIESTINQLEATQAELRSRVHALNEFVDWVGKHAPETLQAYKAYNTVTHAFDRAQRQDDGPMVMAAP